MGTMAEKDPHMEVIGLRKAHGLVGEETCNDVVVAYI